MIFLNFFEFLHFSFEMGKSLGRWGLCIYLRGKDVHETTHVWADEDLFPFLQVLAGNAVGKSPIIILRKGSRAGQDVREPTSVANSTV